MIIKEILSDAASTDDNRDARARRNKHIRKFRDTLEEKRKDFTDTMLAKDHYKALVNSATGSRFYWTLSRHDYVNAVLNTLKGKTDRKQVVLDALNTPLVSSMLKVQASTWSDEGEKHLNSIAEFVEEFVGSVVGSALDGEITAAQQVMETLLRPKLRDGRREALLMLQKITQPWRDGMTMTANDHYFGVSFKKYRAESMRGGGEGESYQDLDPYDCDVDSLTRRLSRRLVEKKDRESCEEAIDCMRAHCKVNITDNTASSVTDGAIQVAQKVFLDNINLLCVEICLIRPIGNLLTDEDIQQIAAAELEDPAGTDALVSER